jgi:hypothetical protein
MDGRLTEILGSVAAAEMADVAAGALGIEAVADAGPVTYREILKPHGDARTIGIVQVFGNARIAGEPPRPWSAVTKVVDTSIVGQFNGASIPENEESVYERGLFARSGGGFRPARCYHISRLSGHLKVLWLEDLTGAREPPFAVDELDQMVGHLGEWNAANLLSPPDLGFAIGRDYPLQRWNYWRFALRATELKNLGDDPLVRAMFAHQPIEVAADYADAFGILNSLATTLPHLLSFGDGPIGNYFYKPGQTIAVDWSGLSVDPVGADGGCFIGSALTWGQQFADIATHERELFESYANGIARGGGTIDRATLRLGYLSHLGFYLGTMTSFPTMVVGPYALLTREFLEKRLGGPIEELGDKLSRVIDLVPSYIAEARRLVADVTSTG